MPTERELAKSARLMPHLGMVLIMPGLFRLKKARARIIADPNSGYNGLPAKCRTAILWKKNFDDETAAGEQLLESSRNKRLTNGTRKTTRAQRRRKFGKGRWKGQGDEKHTSETKQVKGLNLILIRTISYLN
ncbi:MAG: hypothetical protein ACLSE6_00210 [Alphaproteobacteria bacterium]